MEVLSWSPIPLIFPACQHGHSVLPLSLRLMAEQASSTLMILIGLLVCGLAAHIILLPLGGYTSVWSRPIQTSIAYRLLFVKWVRLIGLVYTSTRSKEILIKLEIATNTNAQCIVYEDGVVPSEEKRHELRLDKHHKSRDLKDFLRPFLAT